jgi:hypothetical protein
MRRLLSGLVVPLSRYTARPNDTRDQKELSSADSDAEPARP